MLSGEGLIKTKTPKYNTNTSMLSEWKISRNRVRHTLSATHVPTFLALLLGGGHHCGSRSGRGHRGRGDHGFYTGPRCGLV